jgi:hypothetical protein
VVAFSRLSSSLEKDKNLLFELFKKLPISEANELPLAKTSGYYLLGFTGMSQKF